MHKESSVNRSLHLRYGVLNFLSPNVRKEKCYRSKIELYKSWDCFRERYVHVELGLCNPLDCSMKNDKGGRASWYLIGDGIYLFLIL
jgi:hypothetical protein